MSNNDEWIRHDHSAIDEMREREQAETERMLAVVIVGFLALSAGLVAYLLWR